MTALALSLALGLFLSAGPAQASPETQRQKQLKSQMQSLRDDLDDTSVELAAAAQRLKGWEDQLAQAQLVVDAALARLKAAQQRDAAIAARYRLVREREIATEQQLVVVHQNMDISQNQINALASASYQQGRLSEVAVYLQAKTPQELASRMAYTESAANSEDALLTRLEEQKAVVDAHRKQLETDRLELINLRAQALQVVKDRQESTDQAKQGRARVAQLTQKAREAKRALEKQKASEQARYDKMQAESQAIKNRLAARASAIRSGSGAAVPAISASGFVMPSSGPITSPYGWRIHPIFGYRKFHDGTDFGAGCGSPLYAIASGTVIEKRYSPSWGNRVVLELGTNGGNVLSVGYNHMSGFAVSSGQYVSKGQVVGYVGSTGYSTGCHLHFNFYVNGSTVNPMSYL